MSTVVLTFFPATEAYRADISIGNDAMNLISSCEGILANYHGFAIEDNNVGITVEIATSGEAFKAIVSNEVLFADIFEKFKPTRVRDEITQYHAQTVSDPKIALSGPVTEVCLGTLKNPTPENRARFEKIAEEFGKKVEGKFTYGWTSDDSNKLIIVSAWDSVEAHMAIRAIPEVAASFNEFLSLVDTNGGPYHVQLTAV